MKLPPRFGQWIAPHHPHPMLPEDPGIRFYDGFGAPMRSLLAGADSIRQSSLDPMAPTSSRFRRYLAYGFTSLGLALFIGWHFAGFPGAVWTGAVPRLFVPSASSDYVHRALTAAFLAMNPCILAAPFMIPFLRKNRLSQWLLGSLSGLAGLSFALYVIFPPVAHGSLLLLAIAPLATSLGIFLVKPGPRARVLGD